MAAWICWCSVVLPTSVAAQEADTLDAEKAEIVDGALSLESLLDAPVSAASKYEQTTREAPSSVTVITSDDIEQHGFQTLADALESVGGLHLSNDQRNTLVGVRGFGRTGEYNNRILLLLDGHTLNEGATGVAFIDASMGLDLSLVERIEVVRGPGSALYGTGAMFAVINVVTKPAEVLSTASAGGSLGSLGFWRGRGYGQHRLGRRVDVLVAAHGGASEGRDYYIPTFASKANGGVAQGLDWERSYGARARITVGGWQLHGALAWRHSADPTAPRQVLFGDPDNELTQERGFVELTYDRALGVTRALSVRAYVDAVAQRSLYPYRFADFGNQRVTLTERGSGYTGGGEVRLRWDTSPSNRLILGAEQRFSTLEGGRYLGPAVFGSVLQTTMRVTSFYLQDAYQVTAKLAATLGVRYDLQVATLADEALIFSPEGGEIRGADLAPQRLRAVAPRAALVYNLTERTTLKALYGEAFRSPNVYELYFTDPHINFLANPYLDPERIRTAELIWEQQLTDQLAFSASVYDYRIEDLIDRTVDEATGVIQYQNRGRHHVQAFEAGARVHLASGVRGSLHASTHLNHRHHRQLKNAPRTLVKASAAVPVGGYGTLAALARYEAARLTHAGRVTDPVTLVDLNAQTRPLWNHVRVGLRVQNLFDVTYWHPASPDHIQPFIEQDGRWIQLQAEVSF